MVIAVLTEVSGIGPKEQLTAMGIPVLKDLPGVGMNLVRL